MGHYPVCAMSPPHVAFLGAGAMGCLFGAHLARSGGRVLLVDAWPDHVARLNAHGIRLETPEGEYSVGNVTATDDYAGLRDASIVFVFVKASVTGEAMQRAARCLGPEATVVSVQNGLGNVETLCRHVARARVVAGTTACGATLLGPGRIRVAGIAPTVLGALDGENDERARRVAGLLSRAGLPTHCAGNVAGIIWTKLLVNVGINAIAALTCLPNGTIFTRPEGAELAGKAVAEAARVAEAEGVRLVTDDPVAHVRAVAKATASNAASMLQDIQAGRLTEIDAINGEIVRRGRAFGIPVPVNETLVSLVRLRQSASVPPGGFSGVTAGGVDGPGSSALFQDI